jgi:hypothetical protein
MKALSFSFAFFNDVDFLEKTKKEGAGRFFNDWKKVSAGNSLMKLICSSQWTK